jgi:hypothetical protein
MFKLCTNKNHSYKQNEQINSQNIDNSDLVNKLILFYSILFYMHILMSDLKAH